MIPPTLEQQIQQQISETRPQLRPRVASLPVITTINTRRYRTCAHEIRLLIKKLKQEHPNA